MRSLGSALVPAAVRSLKRSTRRLSPRRPRSHGFADFGRFRKDFLTGHPGAVETFRDPSADVLDLLRRLQAIDNARRYVAVLENITKQLQELIQGGSSGLSRLDFDLAFASLVEARQAMSDEVRQFRDRLDQVKVSLGLSPHAAVVPDRESIAAFPATFDAVESWSRQPDRILSDLPALVERLPALGDVVVDGQPILDGLAHDRDQPEEVLAGAVRLGIKNRGVLGQGQAPADAGPELELRVRRAIRDLVEDRRAYESQKRIYEMGIRLQDQAFERMIAPGAGVISALAAARGTDRARHPGLENRGPAGRPLDFIPGKAAVALP